MASSRRSTWIPLKQAWGGGRTPHWPVGGRRGRRSRLTAKRCAASMARSYPGYAWSRRMMYGPAWCWRKGRVKHIGPLREREGEEEDEGLGATKARAELSVAPQVLRRVTLRGWVVTGDALYCQRTLCQQ